MWSTIQRNPHQNGDRCTLINNLDGQNSIVYDIRRWSRKRYSPFPRFQISPLSPCKTRPRSGFHSNRLSVPACWCQIGVARYPLPSVGIDPDGSANITGLVYRVARGTATAGCTEPSCDAGNRHPLKDTLVVEVNFHFVPGISGGPVFDAETGRAFAYVKGSSNPKVNEFY